MYHPAANRGHVPNRDSPPSVRGGLPGCVKMPRHAAAPGVLLLAIVVSFETTFGTQASAITTIGSYRHSVVKVTCLDGHRLVADQAKWQVASKG